MTTSKPKSRLIYAASAALAAAGIVHLGITPAWLDDLPAYGVFFGLLGAAQLAWAYLFWRAANPLTFLVGMALSGSVIVLWALAQLVSAPFAAEPSTIDAAALAAAGAEAVAVASLLWYSTRLVRRARQFVPALAAFGVGVGALYWGGGALGEALLPQLGRDAAPLDLLRAEVAQLDPVGYQWNLPAGFPVPRVPDDNPMTEAKVELGRYLFYDTRLSANQAQACASCHHQDKAFSDGLARAVGSTGEVHPRNSLTLTNSAYSATLTWGNPVLDTTERQIPIPLFGEFPVEMGVSGHEDEVLERFEQDERYRALFAAAFPDDADPVNYGSITKALASFIRTLISGGSAFDRYVYGGDEDALSASALRGMDLFFSERLECHHCHGGFNLTLSTVHGSSTFVEQPFHNTGLYNIDGEGAYPPGNQGVYEITGDPEDMGRFRAPTLRNVELTAPYMHDGSIATLEEVIRFYEAGGRLIEDGEFAGDGRANPHKSALVPGFQLTDQEREDLLNFLLSLTDTDFVTDPRFANPFVE